jgi:hypothetical protein
VEVAELASVDWSAPWLAPFAKLGQAVVSSSDWRGALNREAAAINLCNFDRKRLVFCAPDVTGDEPYEVGIARTGLVPTRSNLHDFFNALIFLHFPRAKAQLNQLQSAAIARDGVRARRGAVRDAATLIDENAVLVISDRADIVELLRRHDWPSLFQDQRAVWMSQVNVVAFGHALLQKLVHPYKAITAHALHVALPSSSPIHEIDGWMNVALDEQLSSSHLMPLPVLGIPGWWMQNENPDFYADRAVFRPAKMRRDRKAEMDS